MFLCLCYRENQIDLTFKRVGVSLGRASPPPQYNGRGNTKNTANGNAYILLKNPIHRKKVFTLAWGGFQAIWKRNISQNCNANCFFILFTGHLAVLSDLSVMYYNLQETPHTYPLIYIAHVCSALRLRHGQLNACVYKHSRSVSPCCITKDTRLRLLQLKIMASAVTTIYVNLLTYLERKQVHFCCITSVNGNSFFNQHL